MLGHLGHRKQAHPDLHNKGHLDPRIPYNCTRRARPVLRTLTSPPR